MKWTSFCYIGVIYKLKYNKIYKQRSAYYRVCWAPVFWCSFVISWWRHQMETFSALLAICAGNSPSPVNSPHKGQWRRALMFSLICAWINGWINNGDAGDLRSHRAHYDVIIMYSFVVIFRFEQFAGIVVASGKLVLNYCSPYSPELLWLCGEILPRRWPLHLCLCTSWIALCLPGNALSNIQDGKWAPLSLKSPMITSSNGNIFRVTDTLCGELTGGRWIPITMASDAFDVFFDLRLNKRLSKQSRGWWFETLSHSWWRHWRLCCLLYSMSRETMSKNITAP